MLPSIEDIEHFGIFLDFDGTLVELAERPDAVRVEQSTIGLLETLRDRVDGALAVVSGRDVEVVDQMLFPLALPVAGVHGLRRRDAAGGMHLAAIELDEISSIGETIDESVGDEPGLLVERKTGAVALHYRLRPELEGRCREIAERAFGGRPELQLIEGKMVFEVRLRGFDKGDVIEAFLDEPPFLGRTPLFAGDDATDEFGFALVNARGGVSIKIGENSTLARYRAKSVRELLAWLAELARTPRRERVG